MKTEDKKSENLQELTDKIKEALVGVNYGDELESIRALEIFKELNNDDSFTQEIEQILACLSEQTLDLTKLQTQIILIIKKYLGNFDTKKFTKLDTKINEKLIANNIAEVSQYLILQHSRLVKEATRGLLKPKDNLYAINDKLLKDTKRVIKNFAVYQIYKFMNPKRIAGETKKENFAYNFIKGGIEYAKKYEGGAKSDLKKYPVEFIKKLDKARENFIKGGRIIG
ncbi:DUF5394 family protein [Candidatus Tisiphia endosymbiont of Nemotelus uliginosus]|uniref:DUF5394 family protein n=1 Tax=Candidatus Tisiphia endosymbiont of Nemotelus uliginosus TaxID=3077926 RepID=UPI0035C8B2C4